MRSGPYSAVRPRYGMAWQEISMETFGALASTFNVTTPSATRRLNDASLPNLLLRLASKSLIIASIVGTLDGRPHNAIARPAKKERSR